MAKFGHQLFLGLLLFALAVNKCPADDSQQDQNVAPEQPAPPPAPEGANGSDWIYMTAPNGSTGHKEARQAPGSFAASGSNSQAGNGGASASGFAFATAGTNPVLPIIQKTCGTPTPNSPYPWTVAIVTINDEFLCSGILLSDSLILTEARSILDYSNTRQPLKVIIGGPSFPMMNGGPQPKMEFFVAAAAIHPNYEPNVPEHNIALLRLYDNIDFTQYPGVTTICISTLESDYQNPQASCKVLGWPNMQRYPPCSIRNSATLSGEVVTISSCPSYACINASPCNGNIGSSIVCEIDGRFFIWGLLSDEHTCAGGNAPSPITFPVVSTFTNLDFISKYYDTLNPFCPSKL